MPKHQTTNTIDAVAYGDKLWAKMESLFQGVKPNGDKPTGIAAKAEHSMTVAEHYASLDKSLWLSIQTLNAERKVYRKFAKETLSQAHDALKNRHAELNIPKVDGEGKPLSATFENSRFTLIAKDASVEAEATIGAMLDILAAAPDTDLLEESLKKSRNNRIRQIANEDASRYADGEHMSGGNEFYKGTGYASTLLFDEQGVMLGILKMTARCTRAMDRNERKDSGDIYAVLIGDLPFRKDENGNGTVYLNLSPDIADLLIKGRSYHRIAESLGRKSKELQKELDNQRQDKTDTKPLRSEVINDVKDRTNDTASAAAETVETSTPVVVTAPSGAEIELEPAS